MESNFDNDLNNEQILGKYLDVFYLDKFKSTPYSIERCHDNEQQNKGIDLIIKNGDKKYFIDEKAQLDYLDKSLPTFTFELSYYKNDVLKKGWLFDQNKLTNFYFLITAIFCNQKGKIDSGVKSFKVTSVDRKALINYLEYKGLNKSRLNQYDIELRQKKEYKNAIRELDSLIEGNIYYSIQKAERPINIALYLQNLIDNGVAKVL